MPIKHPFVSGKADGGDATKVRPSNWNADHDLTDAPFGPNLVLNSDFSRRTKWMTFMPEVFADTSGWTSASALSVAANVLTIASAGTPAHAGIPTWRDGRWSAQFQATLAAGQWLAGKSVDGSLANIVVANQASGVFKITKQVGGGGTDVATVAQALTLNNWYWLELEAQGTTYIAKLWSSGAAPAAKSASTLLQTLTGTVSDAALVAGKMMIYSDQANSKWGGQSTGDGGVYVEGWGPESWDVTFGGTKGGQAIGFDESANSGPLTKQWAVRAYIPAASRKINCEQAATVGNANASSAYTASAYFKVAGLGGTGALVEYISYYMNTARAAVAAQHNFTDGGSVAWTRKTQTVTTHADTKGLRSDITINNGLTATGTAFFLLPQLEQGSAATAWRNAPADDAPTVWNLVSIRDLTGLAAGEADPRDLAGNLFFPWDATVKVTAIGVWSNSGANDNNARVSVDGSESANFATSRSGTTAAQLNAIGTKSWFSALGVSAGKHRIALRVVPSAGTITLSGTSFQNTQFIVEASRGR